MDNLEKVDVFSSELEWLHSPQIRDFAEKAISMLPDYFFYVAASSTGKYHPAYALGPGGLVRHTKAAVKIAHELVGLEMYRKRYTLDEVDLMLVALILHDGWKHGREAEAGQFTVAEHPVVCADWIKGSHELCSMLPGTQIEFLCGCVASHMGEWNTDYRSNKEILPKPKTAAQKFVHQADYLASRKYLTFEFGDDYYEPVKEEQEVCGNEELPNKISDIVEKCKNIIASGVDKNAVYKAISDINGGNRNPNSIKDIEIANKVYSALEEMDERIRNTISD